MSACPAPATALDLPPGGYHLDPKALRPAKLKKTIPLVAAHQEWVVAQEERRRGRPMYRRLFATLTYAKNTRGDPYDISRFVDCMQAWARRCGVRIAYEWVGELQKRGALHYHLLIWLPKHLLLPKFDKRGWWRHGLTKIERARNPVGYLAKYASKCGPDDVKRLRKGTRLYGFGGIPPEHRESLRRQRMARWARKAVFEREDRDLVDQLTLEAAITEQDKAWLFGVEMPQWARDRLRRDAREREAEELRELLDGPDAETVRQMRMTEAEWEAERRWMAKAANERARLQLAGRALYPKVSGGIVYRPTGELIETPWAAEFAGGILRVWPKETKQ